MKYLLSLLCAGCCAVPIKLERVETPPFPRLLVETYVCSAPGVSIRVVARDLDAVEVDGREIHCTMQAVP